MKRWLGIGVIGIALLFVACGGDDDGGGDTPLSLEAYFDRVEELGADVDRRQDDLDEPEGTSEASGFFDDQAKILEDNLDDMRDLNPPSEVAAAHNTFVSSLDDFAKATRKLADDLDDVDDDDEFFEVLGESDFIEVQPDFVVACEALQAAATSNGITVSLSCPAE